ncbi:MAG: IS110 family transposase [Methanobacteriota archaeon]
MHVGLDAHKKQSVGFVVFPDGKREGPFRFGTTKENLAIMAKRWTCGRVLVEASTTGKGVVRFLRGLGVEAVLVHPDALMMTLRKKKTDEEDAQHIALVGQIGAAHEAYVPTEYEETLRTLGRRRRDMTLRLTELQVKAKAALQRNLVEAPAGRLTSEPCRRRWERLEEIPAAEKVALGGILREIAFLVGEVEAIKLEILKATDGDERIRRLLSIPGVDVMNAAMFLGEFGEMTRFPTPKHAASYAGLTPARWQSAETVIPGRITKRGSPHLRHALLEAAHQATRYPGPVQATYRRLRGRIGTNKTLVACARKLSHVVWAMLTKGVDYATANEDLTDLKRWRHRTISGLIAAGDITNARGLLNHHDPRKARARWRAG